MVSGLEVRCEIESMNKATVVLLLPLAIGALLLAVIDWNSLYTGIIEPLRTQTVLGPLVFIALYIGTCVFLLPGGVLTAAAGLVFGFTKGVLCVSTGATIGALLAFLISRYLVKERVQRYMAEHKYLRALDTAVAKNAFRITILARLCPLIPFRLSNYVFGASTISLKTFALATWLGTLPSASTYVYFGTLAGGLTELQDKNLSTAEIVFYCAGAVLLGGMLVYVSRLAQRVLEEELQSS